MNKNYLEDIMSVGELKLVGYLPLSTIIGCGENPLNLEKHAKDKGLATWLLNKNECDIGSGALYVADLVKLQKFLELSQNIKILNKYNITVDSKKFVELIINETISETKKTDLFDLIAITFKDKRPKYLYRDAIKELEKNNMNSQVIKKNRI